MGTQLHQALRTLCFNTEWKYAVFWKLKHRARMMLTWEDAYYDNHEQRNPPENLCFPEIGGNLRDWHSHDPLGLAVAKMSYHVYSLGEGVIGQVAVTGKHMWISADKHLTDSCSPFEHCDGWQTQFSAGIRTVVVVAIVPHGVIQLGSLKKIPEDLKMVNHIRDVFFALQDSSVGCTPSEIHCAMKSSSCLSDISTRSSGSGIFHDSISNLGRPVNKDKTIICTPTIPSIEKPADHSYLIPLPGDLPKMTTEVINKDGGLELSASGGDESAILQSRPEDFLLGQQKQVWKRLHIERRCEGETSGLGYLGVGSEDHDTQSSNNSFNKINFYNVTLPADDSGVDITYLQEDLLASAACNNQNGMLCIPEPFGMQILRDLENMEFQEINKMEPLNMPFKFSADCELYEVLGPAFQKQNSYCDWEAEKTQTETEIAIEMPEAMDSSSLLTADSGSEHLLEAVVANVCRGGTDVKSEKSFCESVKSLLTTENMPQPTCDKLTVGSAVGSFDQSFVEKETMHCLSSEACGVSSSKGFSSRSHSTFSGQLDSAQEPAKTNKKRARPGENCRPRPRDRQLIQDRIKELRELVPNGSKCSIDSLLERTIKHMLFMQSITKHAEKLKNCNVSKLRDKEMCARGLPIFDQGSTWAVEVGSHMKVCPIMIENINMNGQMLIEMLCEDCTHFLEIADAIRSLGLTILKGVTEACGKKTLMCFVVEGQNRSMHRVDILWPLVQILQSKTTI
ncbi:hypothetical protein ACSBR1_032737 [Camellia fascicularis]